MQELYLSLVDNPTFLDYPRNVSIETLTLCNAACNFCPYTTLDRIGQKMPTELFHKIIDELVVPGKLPKSLHLLRINEPLLDKRIFDFFRYVERRLPGCPCPLTTNGSPLTSAVIDNLAGLTNLSYLKVSLNDCDPERYQQTMKLPFDRTVANLDRLHMKLEAGEIRFRVLLGRVGDGTKRDDEFRVWCEARYPGFESRVMRPFDWIGLVNSVKTFAAPNTGCFQWFDLHFLANGKEAFCSIDAKGIFEDQNAMGANVLQIYNRPFRRDMRKNLLSRNQIDICKGCTY